MMQATTLPVELRVSRSFSAESACWCLGKEDSQAVGASDGESQLFGIPSHSNILAGDVEITVPDASGNVGARGVLEIGWGELELLFLPVGVQMEHFEEDLGGCYDAGVGETGRAGFARGFPLWVCQL